jgi:hypothetical protein
VAVAATTARETGPRLLEAGRATVSVACLTAGNDPQRLAGILALLRPVVDETVVALDDRNESSAVVLGEVADRLVLFPHLAPGDRPIPWLFGLCKSDWIFNIDDDEVPSVSLIAELPLLMQLPELTHCWIARRWLYPDPKTFLDEAPWDADYQLRLVRADPRFLRFSDEFHRPVICEGPMRFVDAPLWHLDTAVNSREQRLAKSVAYERARPGMRAGAYSHNTGYYVPELRSDVRLGPVPVPDRQLISAALEHKPMPSPAVVVERGRREEIDAVWPGEPHPESFYDALIDLSGAPKRLVAGVRQTIPARVTNLGNTPWLRGAAITVGVRWDGAGEGVRSSLPATIEPGESVTIPVHLDPPPGSRVRALEIDLVHEHVRWFGKAKRVSFEIANRRRVALLGSEEGLAAVLRALLLVPDVEPVILDWDEAHPGRYDHGHLRGIGGYLYGVNGTARAAAVLRSLRVIRRPSRYIELRGFERLLIVDDGLRPHAPPRRERLYVLSTAAAARRLGVPVTQVFTNQDSTKRYSRRLRAVADNTMLAELPSLLRPGS